MSEEVVLYDYWRSSAAYRVRIALNLKGIAYRRVPVDLRAGEQARISYTQLNPQGLLPTLAIDGLLLNQSLAIIEYIDQTRPGPAIIPPEPARRAQAMAHALIIAADTHPIQNLRVMNYLRENLAADEDLVLAWNRHWIALGFAALEAQAPATGLFGGAAPGLADICLVPQMANARRFNLDLGDYPRLVAIDAILQDNPAFVAAAPESVRPV